MSLLSILTLVVPAAAVVNVEILYGPYCPNSANYLSANMPKLFASGLDVQLTLLPYVLEDHEMPPAPECTADVMPCHYLPAPLCALQSVAMPGPLASVEKAVNFAVCDLAHANAGAPAALHHTINDIRQCAVQESLDFAPIQACMANPVPTPAYLAKVKELDAKLPGGMIAPFVFVDGDYVDTMASGNLMVDICRHLPAGTSACMQPEAKYSVSASNAKHLEWLPGSASSALLLSAVALAAVGGSLVVVRNHRRRYMSSDDCDELVELVALKEGSELGI